MKPRIATTIALAMSMCCLGAANSRDKGTGLVQKQFAAWNSHDENKVASFYTDDVVYEDVAFGLKAHGHAEMRKLVSDFFPAVPDLKLEVASNMSMGNRGAVEWVFSGTDVGLYKTGKKFSVRGASVYELRDGKFSSNRDYYDSASIMRQVGILPTAAMTPTRPNRGYECYGDVAPTDDRNFETALPKGGGRTDHMDLGSL